MSDSHERACQLAAYVPLTLVKQLVTDGLPEPGHGRSLTAATLFADISGFTLMSEELATDGPRGAEELNRVLVTIFDAFVEVIHQLGGAIAHFYGDGLGIYFPDEDGFAARRALACAQQMQQLVLNNVGNVQLSRPAYKTNKFQLTMKIGASYGSCLETVIGDSQTGLEFVVSGPATDSAGVAQKKANVGQIVASQEILSHIDLPSSAEFQTLETAIEAPPSQLVFDTAALTDETTCQRVIKLLAPFISPALQERLTVPGLSILAEHRPVTNMFVEFSFRDGVAKLSENKLLHQYYSWASQVVARYGTQNARINRVLTGDKGHQLHIIFGAPVAPDAPEQALRCALALQNEQPPYIVEQQIGVTAGMVFAAPLGASARREYTIVGDVVNIAARLAELCAPGQVLTDQITAERTQRVLALTPLKTVSLRGKQAVVTPYKVQPDQTKTTQLAAYYSRFRRSTVGRETEQAQLIDHMDKALNGTGGLVILTGRAGTGKSRLLAAAVDNWLSHNGRGLLGVCYQHTAETPYAPWRNIWHDFFDLHVDMPLEDQVTAVVEKTHTLVPDFGDDVNLWGEVLGIPFPQSDALAALSPAVRQARFLRLARHCLQNAAGGQPLLIVLEGIQWADTATMALLNNLVEHMNVWPIFVAVTYRQGQGKAPDIIEQPQCFHIPLHDLSPDEARRLLHELIGTRHLPAALEQQLGLRDREGRASPVNALFLEEALQEMMAMGVLQVNGRMRINEQLLPRTRVPDTIHGLLMARIDRLPAANRGLLQVASVIGRQFGLEPLNAITPETPLPMVTELLTYLTEAQITQLVAAEPEWFYLFQHAMVHEVTYGSLPFVHRQRLHAAVADWLLNRYADNLKPIHPLLAYHYSQANLHEEGLRYALEAANEARDIFANQEAVDLYTLAEKHLEAVGLEAQWETAVTIFLSRSEASLFIGEFDSAIEDVKKAIDIAKTHRDLGRQLAAQNHLAELHYRQSRYEEARHIARDVISRWDDTIKFDELARANQWIGSSYSRQLMYEPALAYLRRAETICLQTGNEKRLALIVDTIAYINYVRGELDLALEAMLRSTELTREYGTAVNLAATLNNIALIQAMLGRPQQALTAVNEAIATASDTSRNFLANFQGNRAVMLAYIGQFAAALDDFEKAMAYFEATNDSSGMVEIHLLWGYEYCCVRELWDEAEQHFRQAQRLMEERPQDFLEQNVRLLLGKSRLLLHKRQLSPAEEILEQCAQLIDDKGVTWWLPATHYYQGLLYEAQQDISNARSILQEALSAVDAGGSPDYRPLVTLALAKTMTDDLRWQFLEQCLVYAAERARYQDRINCFREAGSLLTEAPTTKQRQMGLEFVHQADLLTQSSGEKISIKKKPT